MNLQVRVFKRKDRILEAESITEHRPCWLTLRNKGKSSVPSSLASLSPLTLCPLQSKAQAMLQVRQCLLCTVIHSSVFPLNDHIIKGSLSVMGVRRV